MSLDVLPCVENDSSGTSNHRVLAVYQDGTVACYSRDLATESWNTQLIPSQPSDSNVRIEHASISSRDEAQQALLKSREDILVPLDTAGDDSYSGFLLTIIRTTRGNGEKRQDALELKIFHIETAATAITETSRGKREKLKPLASLMIPEPLWIQSRPSTVTFHVASGTMYQNVEGFLAIYDFINLIPRLIHEIDLFQDTKTSYLRLSTNLLACGNAVSLTLVTLPYISIQAESNMDEFQDSRKPTKMMARKSDLHLLSYFARLDLVVALDGRRLITMPVSTANQRAGDTRKWNRDGLLVNSLGRGPSKIAKTNLNGEFSNHDIKSLGSYINLSSAQASQSQPKAELDLCAARNDQEGFESIAISLLGLEIQHGSKLRVPSTHHAHVDLSAVYEIICRIFSVIEDQHRGLNEIAAPRELKIRFLPQRICNWLMERGYLTAGNIEKSLKRSGALAITGKLATGTLERAFAEWDSSLELLSTLLASPVPLSSGELVHVLAISTRESSAAHSRESPYRLTNGNGSGSVHDTPMELTNGEMSRTSSSLQQLPPNETSSHRILTTVMKKLYSTPSSSLARVLRTELSTSQLRLLVDALRMEIAQAGLLSPYEQYSLSAPNEPSSSPPSSDLQISHIAHLLNCTIDSIGTGGWMLSSSSTSTTDENFADSADTVSYMKAEISAALEGIEEATYLKGMIGEMLLCGKDTLVHSSQRAKLLKNDDEEIQMASVQAMRPVTVPLEEVSKMLPLGLKTTRGAVSSTVVKAGGEVRKRRRRDVGRLKSRMVGKYSFERIVI